MPVVSGKGGALRLKYCVPGVGYVKVGFEGDDPVKEVLELTKASVLTAKDPFAQW